MDTNQEKQRWVGKFTIQAHEAIGDLAYDPVEGISLEARLWPPPQDHSRFMPYPLINGHVAGDRPCTLFDAGDKHLRHTPAEEFHRIEANTLLVGLACKSADEPLFTAISFRSPALTAFVQPRNIKVKRSRSSFRAFNASYKPSKAISGRWGKHRIEISAFGDAPIHQGKDGTFEAVEIAHYQINFASPVSLNCVLGHLTALEFFLGLVVGQFAGAPTVFLAELPGTTSHGSVQLFRTRSWYAAFNYNAYRLSHVSMKELGKHAIPILARWFRLFPRIERVTETYRAAQLIPQIETTFIFLAQSIEGLHRTCLARPAIEDADFQCGLEALRGAIPAHLPRASKQFFVDRLRMFNEPGLRGRLKDFLKVVKDKIPTALEHAEMDINGIVDLRNEFSHGTLSDEPQPFNFELINYYSHAVQTMFDIGLLSILGVEKDLLSHIYYGNPRYSQHDDNRRRLAHKKAVPTPRRKTSR